MKKKGQSALEFLMSYGWMLLVVVGAIGALAYMGVLNLHGSAPDVCMFSYGIACQDQRVGSDHATLYLTNSLGKDITITNISVAGCSEIFAAPFENGESTSFNVTSCSFGQSGGQVAGRIIISYTTGAGIQKTLQGELKAKIE